MTLSGDPIPAGSTVSIMITVNGAGPFPYVTNAPIPASPFWVTDLFTPAATPADFDGGYGGRIEIYSIAINSAGGNPLELNGSVKVESIISKNSFVNNTVLDDIDLAFTIPPDEAAALAWLQANTNLTSSSGTIADMTATFPASIPPVIVAAPYKINSRMTLSGDPIPAGSTVSIMITVNGAGPFPYVTNAPIPASPFWVTDLFTPAATPADFDGGYGGRIEIYSIAINSAGGNPLELNGSVKVESIISKNSFVNNTVLDDIDLAFTIPPDEAAALAWLQANTNLTSVLGTIADMTATFPPSIPPVIVAAPYKINSRMTLSGDPIPAGSTVSIMITVNGAGPFPYVTNAPIPASPFWVTDLFTPAATPADFDGGYGGRIEIYSIAINSAGGNPLELNGSVKVESIISKNSFVNNTVLDDIDLAFTIPPDEAAALAWLQANTNLTSSSGTIADMTATFPASIPPVIVAAPYKINSRMTLSGDPIPAGSTVSIMITVNGAGPFPYVTNAPIPASPFWVTDLFTPAATPADFDGGYGGRIEIYSIAINSAGGNPLELNGSVKVESIISKNSFVNNTVLDDIDLAFTIPAVEAGPEQDICGSLVANTNANVPDAGTGAWSMTSGIGNIEFGSISDPTTTATASLYGTYVLRWTITNSTSTSFDEVTYNYRLNPTASITPDPATMHVGGSISLNGNPSGGSGTWSTHAWTGDIGTYLSSASAVNPTFSGAPAGSYNLTYTVTDDKGCTGSDNITIIVYGTELYVNDNSQTGDTYTSAIGNDANPGTATAPLLTITKAISVALAGDVIYVDAGTYNENVFIDKQLTLTGAGSALSIIDLSSSSSGYEVRPNAPNVTFEGFTVRNGSNNGIYVNGENAVIRNNAFTGNSVWDIFIASPGCSVTNNDFNNSNSQNAIGFAALSVNGIHNNKLGGNYQLFAIRNLTTNPIDATENWFGLPTGPAHASNPCGTGENVDDNVLFSPWYFQSSMTTLNGLPVLTLTNVPDIATITGTPIIMSETVTYPSLVGYDAAVLTDAVISTTATAFPAGTKVIEVIYTEGANPPASFTVDYDLSTGNSHYLSDILGNASPYGTPLVNHSGLSINWQFVIEGATDPISGLPVSIQSVSYLDRSDVCLNQLGDSESFTVTFNDVDFDYTASTACYPAAAEVFYNETYPLIDNNGGTRVLNDSKWEFFADAALTIPVSLPIGAQITVGEISGGVYTWSRTSTLTVPASFIYGSAIVTQQGDPTTYTNGQLVPLERAATTNYWKAMISNVPAGTYYVRVKNLAMLDPDGTSYNPQLPPGSIPQGPHGTFSEYVYDQQSFKMVYVGAAGVTIAPVDNISTVTSTPVIIPVSVTYPDLAAQNIDPSVLTDARITTTSGTFPTGARVFKVTYEGVNVPITPYVFGASQSEVLLSTILGQTANPLIGHSGTIDWEIFVDGITDELTVPVKIQAIAYVNYASCYSVMDDEEFSITYADVDFDYTASTACYPAAAEVFYNETYPLIDNNGGTRVLNDSKWEFFADAALTIPVSLPIGAQITVGEISGGVYTWSRTSTLTVPASFIYGSAIVTQQGDPTTYTNGQLVPLERAATTNYWKAMISNVPAGTYYVRVKNLAMLDPDGTSYNPQLPPGSIPQGPHGTFSEYVYDQQSFKMVYVGAAGVTIAPVDDISTVTSTPVIIPVSVTYPDLAAQNIDPSVLTDARITTTSGTFPTGARVFKVTYEGVNVPITPYVFGASQSEVLLSTILGQAANPLIGHSGTIDWEIFVDGITDELAVPVKIQAIAYVNYASCYSVMDDEEFSITYADVDFDYTASTACYPAAAEVFYNETYPLIDNNGGTRVLNDSKWEFFADAALTIPVSLPIGAQITVGEISGGVYTWSRTSTLTVPASFIYGSAIVTQQGDPTTYTNGQLVPLERAATTNNWKAMISNVPAGTYYVRVKNLAMLDPDGTSYNPQLPPGSIPQGPHGTFSEYVYDQQSFKMVYVGAAGVTIEPVDNISTVTSTPVIIPVSVTYPDLAAQNIDPSVLTDARITTTSGTFPAGARVFKVTYEGVNVPISPYVFGASQSEVLLSTILGQAANPLIGHSGTIDWELFVDGITAEVTVPVKVEAIAYVNYASCYSVMDDEEFSITFEDAVQTLSGTYEDCYPATLVVNSSTNYPFINVDGRVKSDALIETDVPFNEGATIRIEFGGWLDVTWPVPTGGISDIYVSEMLNSSPNPLSNESEKMGDLWKFTIEGLNVGTYNISVKAMARLDEETGPPTTYADYTYDTDLATLKVFANPTASIQPDPATVVYGSSLPLNGNPAAGSGTINSHSWSGTGAAYLSATNIADPTFSGAPVGTYSLTYVVSDNNGCSGTDNITVTVTQKALTITANSDSKEYGSLYTFLGTEFTTLGLVNADAVNSCTITSDGAAVTAIVGGYDINISDAVGTGLGNYTISYVKGTLTVNKKALTVTANSDSKEYGSLYTFLGTEFSTVGLVNADAVNACTITSDGAAVTAIVGGYDINISNAVGTGLGNYTISYVKGTLTVNKKALTVTANSDSKEYGSLYTFLGTEFSTLGLVNADAVNTCTITSDGAPVTAIVGGYDINISDAVGTGLGNYTITYVKGTLTVNKKALTVTANSDSKEYGSLYTFLGTEFSTVGLVNADAVNACTITSDGAPVTAIVGGYDINISDAVGTGLGNYTITYVKGTLTVNKKALTVTANSDSKEYGSLYTFLGTEFTTLGLVNADAVNACTITSDGAPVTASAGGYDINISDAVGTGLGNYTITYVKGTLTVNKKALTVTANSDSKEYGSLYTFLGTEFSTVGLVNADAVNACTITSDGAAVTAIVGGYDINISDAVGTGLGNYTISYVKGTLTVNKKALTVTANSDSKEYGSLYTFLGTEFSTVGLVNADAVNACTITSDGAPVTAIVGGYDINISDAVGTGLGNYTISYVKGTLTVNKKALTITANSDSKEYGSLYTFLGTEFTTLGLVNADAVNACTITSDGAPVTASAGGYDINISDAVGTGLGNYTITYVKGTLTVNKKALTVTANSDSKEYGSLYTFLGTEFSTVGLVNADAVNACTITSDGAPVTASAGGYDINISDAVGTGLGNYTITYVKGTLTVNKKALTVTANSDSKEYGSLYTFLGTEFSTVGLVNADAVNACTITSDGAAVTAIVGGYDINISDAVGTGLGNYTISYVKGTLTVNKKALTVTANSDSKEYGSLYTFLGTEFTTLGLVNADAVNACTITSDGAPVTASAGGYDINISDAVGTGLGNYTISYVKGTLTVNKKALTVTAENKSKCYDGAVFPYANYTVTYSGFITGEDPADLGGTLVYTGTAITAVNPGDWVITPEGLTSGNYAISFVNGTLTIFSLPAPVISGPATVSINTPANYSTPFTAGHTYAWTVTGGVIQGASNASVVSVLWGNNPGTGTLNVTDINTLTGCSAPSETYYVTITGTPLPFYKVSGVVTYHHISNPDLWMDNTSLTLMEGSNVIATTTTNALGYYEFLNVPDGTYKIEATTNKPRGGLNASDAGLVNYWWTHRTPIERVRWNAGNFYAIDNFMNATDAGQINGFFTTGTPQPAQEWFFWKQGALSSSNPPVSVNTFVVSGADLVQNYYALCVADFNRSFSPPPGLKSSAGASSIHLLYDEPLVAGPGSEVILPIQVTSALKAGAISMIIDFPSDYVTVEDVVLGNGDLSTSAPLQFNANGNELRIGWFDQVPFDLQASDCLVTLKLRTTANFTNGHTIRFSMQENYLNELADGMFEPIGNVVLLTRDIVSSITGIDPQEPALKMSLTSHPNPFYDVAWINYTLPYDDEVWLEITNMYGARVTVLVDATQTRGDYTVKLDGISLNPGVYTVTLRTNANALKPQTIKIVRGW
jgi:hypothetical protein